MDRRFLAHLFFLAEKVVVLLDELNKLLLEVNFVLDVQVEGLQQVFKVSDFKEPLEEGVFMAPVGEGNYLAGQKSLSFRLLVRGNDHLLKKFEKEL